VIAARDRASAHAEQVGALLPFGRLAAEDLWPARGVGCLFATIARLGASGDWVALSRAALEAGWEASH